MAYRHRYVDPDATGSATGTSWANAYTSLNTAENTEDDSGDIRATGGSNEIVVFHCRSSSGTADSAAVIITGWTTDSGGYIVIVCDKTGDSYGGGETDSIGGRHGGVWNTSKYRLSVTDSIVINIQEDYVQVDGLQIENVSPTANAKDVVYIANISATNNALYLSNSLIKGHGHATYTQSGVNVADSDAIVCVWNCIVCNVAAITSNRTFVSGGTTSAYSCTFIGGQYAFRSNGTTVAKNVYAGGSSAEDFFLNSGTLAKVNCASDDASADDDNGSTETQSNCVINATYSTSSGAYFKNVSAGSEDLRIADAPYRLSGLYRKGTQTSGESAPLDFTTDIEGQTRSSSSGGWDIGADGIPGGLTRHVYVDTDVVGGSANGTSWANAYSSLNTAEQAEDDTGNIVGSDEYVVFHCRGVTAGDTAAVAVNGWTTDATRYIQIQCDSGDGHGGVWTTSKYRLYLSVSATPCLIQEDYVRVDRLQLGRSTTTGSLAPIVNINTLGAANTLYLSNLIIRQAGNATYTEPGIYINDSDAVVVVWNTIVYGLGANASSGNSGIYCAALTSCSLYSCTIGDGYLGLRSVGTVTCKNVYARGTQEGFGYVSGTLAKTNCASADASATDTGASETATNCVANVDYSTSSGAYFTNVTAGSEDLRIASASSALVNAGTDTSGESAPLNFTTDIAGQTRS